MVLGLAAKAEEQQLCIRHAAGTGSSRFLHGAFTGITHLSLQKYSMVVVPCCRVGSGEAAFSAKATFFFISSFLSLLLLPVRV
jgi:hypothetical protein